MSILDELDRYLATANATTFRWNFSAINAIKVNKAPPPNQYYVIIATYASDNFYYLVIKLELLPIKDKPYKNFGYLLSVKPEGCPMIDINDAFTPEGLALKNKYMPHSGDREQVKDTLVSVVKPTLELGGNPPHVVREPMTEAKLNSERYQKITDEFLKLGYSFEKVIGDDGKLYFHHKLKGFSEASLSSEVEATYIEGSTSFAELTIMRNLNNYLSEHGETLRKLNNDLFNHYMDHAEIVRLPDGNIGLLSSISGEILEVLTNAPIVPPT